MCYLPHGNDASAAKNALLCLRVTAYGAFSISLQYTVQHWTEIPVFYTKIRSDNIRCYTEEITLQLPELKLVSLPHVALCYTDATIYSELSRLVLNGVVQPSYYKSLWTSHEPV